MEVAPDKVRYIELYKGHGGSLYQIVSPVSPAQPEPRSQPAVPSLVGQRIGPRTRSSRGGTKVSFGRIAPPTVPE
jgi:hypothetical protein